MGSPPRRPEWWVACGNFSTTERRKRTAKPTPDFFGDLFLAVPPPKAGMGSDAIARERAENQVAGEETQVVEWLTAKRGQLFVIPDSSLCHVHLSDPRAEGRAWA